MRPEFEGAEPSAANRGMLATVDEPWHVIAVEDLRLLPGASTATNLVIVMVLTWSMASHLAWTGPREGAMAEAGLPSRVVSGEELQDFLPIEPLWEVVLPLLGLSMGTYGVQLTLGFTFVEPLLMLLLPSMLGALREFHDELLSWHLGGIFGQPMLVAQVAIVRAERHASDNLVPAFGALVGYYSLGAVLGAALRRCLELHLSAGLTRKVLRQSLVLAMVLTNLFAVWRNGHLLGEHPDHSHEEHGQGDAAPSERSPLLSGEGARKAQRLLQRVGQLLWGELVRAVSAGVVCARPLAARSLLLLGLTAIIGPAPLPPVDLFALTPLHQGFTVLWFDVVGILSSAFLVPLLLGIPKHQASCLDTFFQCSAAACFAAVLAAAMELASALNVAMLAGLAVSSCTAAANAVLTVHMAKQAHRPVDVGVCLAWGLLFGGVAQLLGAELGRALFLRSSWMGVCAFAGSCCVAAKSVAGQALAEDAEPKSEEHVQASRPAPRPVA